MFFIEDDSFLTKKQQDDFFNSIWSNPNDGSISWEVQNIKQVIDRQSNPDIGWQYSETPLIHTSDKNSEPFLQIMGYLDQSRFKHILDIFCEKHGISYSSITRSKINVLTKTDSDKVHYPHVDNIIKHYVFLYYFNDSDGDTVIYNSKISDALQHGIGAEGLSEAIRSSPKAGKAIMFDGAYLHSGQPPKIGSFRCVLNVNIYVKKD